jgi:class 3 adenylate cyclase/streptogramin lyase
MPRGPERQRVLATVLFSDIVGSTEKAEALGDRQWRHVLATHHRIVRRALKEHRGKEIDTAGDGFFARFDQPSDAIDCALEMIRRLRGLDIDIRAGVHMGEVEITGSNLTGITVHVGARVMSKAGAGEVFVSGTVRDLMSGSDVTFEDEGFHELKGVASQVHLFAVRPEGGTRVDRATVPAIAEEEPERRRRVRLIAVVAAVFALALITAVVVLASGGGSGFTPAANTVARLALSDGAVIGGVTVGTRPTVLAYDGDHSIWVGNFDDETIQRIDVDGVSADAARGGVGSNPTGLATGEHMVWVCAGFAGDLIAVDPRQPNLATPIELGTGIRGVAFGEGAVWVASPETREVIRVDPATQETMIVPLPEGSEPRDVAVGDGAVWVADWGGGRVLQIDPTTLKMTEIPLLGDRKPSRIAVGEGFVWVTSTETDSLTRIDPASNRPTTVENVGDGPLGVAAGGGSVWVANSLDGSVARIDPVATNVLGRTALGFSPDSVVVAADSVWVSLHEP